MGALALPRHTAMVVDDTLKFTKDVTVYTNGQSHLVPGIAAAIEPTGARIDDRNIKRFVPGSEGSEIIIAFEDGEQKVESFVVHQPATKVPSFVEKLGLEISERGDVVVAMAFYQTKVLGVFAAGDCASPFKIISNAMLMGANAGAGLARELPVRVTGNAVDREAGDFAARNHGSNDQTVFA